MPRFQSARFHELTGPPELFGRVRFKMQDANPEDLAHATFKTAATSAMPARRLQKCDPDRWRLMPQRSELIKAADATSPTQAISGTREDRGRR